MNESPKRRLTGEACGGPGGDSLMAETVTLGDALPREMARVRDVLIPAYMSIGHAGVFGLAMLRQELDAAAKAMASGDVVAMLQAYQALKECE